ncbi:Dihydroxy-acid dehydratase [Kribbella flavida DSM 17836]|uniref:Dihydroxy-acid dehydratase n=1 Tax=Kribbella flavida (strain DSM 17836 / JCM 10339 / NBRC 14399) TaxID=479435 RepID=D2PZQ7_KRIFD|nr:IlvD/Edd family dehydratase [Kribbella flavida]ADB35623.1 Dihydroxy-acid dehydratase [Kribbella flavida DSM 17836]
MTDLPPTNDPNDRPAPGAVDPGGEPTPEKTGRPVGDEPGRPSEHIGRRSFDHWFGEKDRNGFIHRSWMRAQGFSDEVFDGRPVIGICNTWSELTPCNAHLRRLAESVKRGVWQAGGFPLEFPVMSLGETMLRPTAMLFRNLLSMDVEESLRGNPIDGAVLLTGCDKTTPGSIMGAASVDLPTLVVTGGPMLNGKFRGCDIGSGTAVWRFTQDRNAGRMSEADYAAAESGMSRSNGHCMTMGTASTMACMAEALGLQLTGSAAIPAVDSRRYSIAQQAGQRIVQMVHEDLKPSDILTRDAFANAVRANAAIGGSTNAVIHLLAIAGRVGVDLTLDDMDEWARGVPWLVDLQPSGKYLMEDFYYAGGLPAVLREILPLLKADAVTVTGKTIGENVANAERTDWSGQEGEPAHPVIRPVGNPLGSGAGTAVLKGNLAPDGAVVKQSAASERLLQHRGRALVFSSIEEYDKAVDDPDLDVDEDTVLVLQNAGPRGYPGMPEVGNMTIPRKLAEQGVEDMVRISDARMSGTAYGTVVLHVAPEAAVGGPLALVRTGDWIELDVPARRLHLDVSDEELAKRRADWQPTVAPTDRGWARLYVEHVTQANQGCDLDFLIGRTGSAVARQSH